MSSNSHYTPYQLFVLSYMTIQELHQQTENLVFGQPAVVGMTYNYRFTTSVNELSTIVSPHVIPGKEDKPKTIMENIKDEMQKLFKDDLIKY